MNNPYTTIPAPGPGEDTTFTYEVWEQHDMPPILHLAEGWTTIEEQAFLDSPDLEMIHIPASVVSIQDNAFNGAISLRQVEFAQGSRLEFIGDGPFARTEALKSISIPAGVTHIGDKAFSGATGLEQITFDEGSQLDMIGFQTFADTTSLQTIRIPASVASIDTEAFFRATGLIEVAFEEGSQLEFIGDGVFADARALQRIQIPVGVGHIGQAAFLNATSLQTIHIPRLVETLMIHTFENATSLREVTFEEGSVLMSIGDDAFNSATALQTIQIPAEVQVIRQGAFQNATALQTIRIPAGVREIGDRAFANTQALREITFEQDSQINSIGYDAFGRSGLRLVAIGETAVNRLNADAISRNRLAAVNPSPFRPLPQLRFGENNNFYGKYNVKIVSRTQQIDTLQLITKKPAYKKQGFFGKILGKPKKQTRAALPDEMTREIGKFLMPAGVEPKSPAALANRKGGARKPRTRKRGIRRRSRKASGTRRTKKGRRTMKRK
jgi:hypothetical protein